MQDEITCYLLQGRSETSSISDTVTEGKTDPESNQVGQDILSFWEMFFSFYYFLQQNCSQFEVFFCVCLAVVFQARVAKGPQQ